MHKFQPSDHLHSKTFVGLLIAQFLAAFNDQAIHASAMFFAFNTQTLNESQAITLMPVLFYAPWAIFCTIAGYFADKYSKRQALVLWKVIEVAIAGLALLGFWLGRHEEVTGLPQVPHLGTWIVLSTVFLMGMHSAFFVPAKYGIMPEILTPRMLSRGNGALESLSFLAVILGTVAGGVLSTVFRGEEYKIGYILVILAALGALASFMIVKVPAASPDRPFPEWVYGPLIRNIRLLLTSRPLVFAVVGIAFFTFLVAYMRQVVYMHGQSQQPPWSEAYTSIIVGMVALGIGIGSPLAGYWSGGKVEVGLVPVGALGMVIATTVAAFSLSNVPVLVVCIVAIGFFTGFYLVPLFSLIQHRAPRTSKGDSIATSNFINITGALAATAVFFSLNTAAIRTGFVERLQPSPEEYTGTLLADVEPRSGRPYRAVVVPWRAFVASEEPDLLDQIRESLIKRDHERPSHTLLIIDRALQPDTQVTVRTYELNNVTYYAIQPAGEPPTPVYDKRKLPELLFLGTGGMTLVTLLLLWYFLPDLFRRTRWWLRGLFAYRMEVAGLLGVPGNGPTVIITDADSRQAMSHVKRAVDRVLVVARSLDKAQLALARRRVVAITLTDAAKIGDEAIDKLLCATDAPVLPVHYRDMTRDDKRVVFVVAEEPLAIRTIGEARKALECLGRRVARHGTADAPLETEAAAPEPAP